MPKVWQFITLGHIRILTIKSLFIFPILFPYTSKNIYIIMQYTRKSHITHDIIEFISVRSHMKKHNYSRSQSFSTNTHHSGTPSCPLRMHLGTPPVRHEYIVSNPPALHILRQITTHQYTMQARTCHQAYQSTNKHQQLFIHDHFASN